MNTMFLIDRVRVWRTAGLGLIFSLQSLVVHAELPLPEIETLPNGLQVVWFLKDSLPVIDLSLLVNAGHRDDPFGKSGTSELLVSTLDRGAGKLTATAIAREVERLGAIKEIVAEDDSVRLGFHGLAPDAPELLEILAKITLHPDFSEAEVSREHARILDRWSHLGDSSDSLASLAYQRIMTADTVYGRGKLLSMREFKNVDRSDVIQFHKRYFSPKNCILLVVGRVDPVEFKKKILSFFGDWQGEQPKHENRTYRDSRLFGKSRSDKDGRKNSTPFIIVDRPNLNQAQVRMGLRAPLIQSPSHHALMVANALLGGYFNSRLNTQLRDKLGLTYSIQSALIFKKEYAECTISSSTRNDKVGLLIQKVRDILRNLKKGPISQSEVDTAKTYLQGSFPLTMSTLHTIASRWLEAHFLGLKDDYLNEFTKKIGEVQLQDVQKAVAQFIDLNQLGVGVAGDVKKITPGLAELELDAPRVVTLEDLL